MKQLVELERDYEAYLHMERVAVIDYDLMPKKEGLFLEFTQLSNRYNLVEHDADRLKALKESTDLVPTEIRINRIHILALRQASDADLSVMTGRDFEAIQNAIELLTESACLEPLNKMIAVATELPF